MNTKLTWILGIIIILGGIGSYAVYSRTRSVDDMVASDTKTETQS